MSAIRPASDWLLAQAQHLAFSEALCHRMDICLNEALANILFHGGLHKDSPPIEITLHYRIEPRQGFVSLTLSDSGLAFDVTSQQTTPRPESLDEAEPGGLGVLMIRQYCDSLEYRYDNGRNHLHLLFITPLPAELPHMLPARQPFARQSDRRQFHFPVSGQRRSGSRRISEDVSWIGLFKGVDQHSVQKALATCQVALLPAGATLLDIGAYNQDVFILLSGKFSAYLLADQAPEKAIPIPTGACVGELSAIDGKPASARVVAETPARVLEVPKAVFWDQLMAIPGVAGNLMLTLTERMRTTNAQALQAQREQIELQHLKKELEMARQLQLSMVPQQPMFAEDQRLALGGMMEPAAQVGGDLFDAFMVQENRLFLCIGDVSGHGIASALFMARTVGLIRLLAMQIHQPDKLLTEVNARLCIDNDTNLFVTLFCAFLDTQTGQLDYSNAGHCPPYRLGQHSVEKLPLPKGILLGAFAEAQYHSFSTRLEKGEKLFCYTDGLSEAQDTQGEEYGDQRAMQILHAQRDLPVQALLELMRAQIRQHTGTDLLEDDCTLLVAGLV